MDSKVNLENTPLILNYRKRIFVCSPLRATLDNGEIDLNGVTKNIEKAWEYCRLVTLAGFRPFAPHAFYTKFLDEANPAERALGITLGLEELADSNELWYFGNKISTGMSVEIKQATEWGIPVFKGEEQLSLIQEKIHTYY